MQNPKLNLNWSTDCVSTISSAASMNDGASMETESNSERTAGCSADEMESSNDGDVTAGGSSSAILSSHYYTQSDTEAEEINRRTRGRRRNFNFTASSCDESDVGSFFHASNDKFKRRRSISPTTLYNLRMERLPQPSLINRRQHRQNARSRRLLRPQPFVVDQLNNKNFSKHSLENKQPDLRTQHRDKDCREKQSCDRKFIAATSTPNSKVMKKTAKKRTLSNNGSNSSSKNRFYQQKIADYYRATARRKANYHYFTTNNNKNNDGSGDGGSGEFNGKGKSNGKYNGNSGYQFHHQRSRPHHHYHRPYPPHQQQQWRQCKTPITTSAKRRNYHNAVASLTRRNSRQVQSSASDVEICKSPVLLDSCMPIEAASTPTVATPILETRTQPRIKSSGNDNLVGFSKSRNVNNSDVVILPLLPNSQPPVMTSIPTYNNHGYNYCYSKSNEKENVESRIPPTSIDYYGTNHYYSGADSGCMEDVESLSKTDGRYRYGNIGRIYDRNPSDIIHDDDETQFMNISDEKIYENLKHDTMARLIKRKRTALDDVTHCNQYKITTTGTAHTNFVQSSSPTTTATIAFSAATASTSSSNTDNISSNSSTTTSATPFFKKCTLDDEPELYGRLVGTVIKDARRANWFANGSMSRAILDAQYGIEKMLQGDAKNANVRQKLSNALANNKFTAADTANGGAATVAAWKTKVAYLPVHDLRLLSTDSNTFEEDCTALCAQIAEKLRKTRAQSTKDYNDQIRKIQKIICQLKNVTINSQQLRPQPAKKENGCAFMIPQLNANSANSGGGSTIQKFFGRIRSMF